MKKFYIQNNIGKAKYVVNYHKEGSFNKDGSEFFDIAIFRNKKALKKFIDMLNQSGYVELTK